MNSANVNMQAASPKLICSINASARTAYQDIYSTFPECVEYTQMLSQTRKLTFGCKSLQKGTKDKFT